MCSTLRNPRHCRQRRAGRAAARPRAWFRGGLITLSRGSRGACSAPALPSTVSKWFKCPSQAPCQPLPPTSFPLAAPRAGRRPTLYDCSFGAMFTIAYREFWAPRRCQPPPPPPLPLPRTGRRPGCAQSSSGATGPRRRRPPAARCSSPPVPRAPPCRSAREQRVLIKTAPRARARGQWLKGLPWRCSERARETSPLRARPARARPRPAPPRAAPRPPQRSPSGTASRRRRPGHVTTPTGHVTDPTAQEANRSRDRSPRREAAGPATHLAVQLCRVVARKVQVVDLPPRVTRPRAPLPASRARRCAAARGAGRQEGPEEGAGDKWLKAPWRREGRAPRRARCARNRTPPSPPEPPPATRRARASPARRGGGGTAGGGCGAESGVPRRGRCGPRRPRDRRGRARVRPRSPTSLAPRPPRAGRPARPRRGER